MIYLAMAADAALEEGGVQLLLAGREGHGVQVGKMMLETEHQELSPEEVRHERRAVQQLPRHIPCLGQSAQPYEEDKSKKKAMKK